MRVLFASTRGAGHFHPLVPFIEACRRAGHEVLVAGPTGLAGMVRRAGYPFSVGAAPPEDELGPLWAHVPTLSSEDAERVVFGDIFATLNVRAMLPAMRTAVRKWRPDVLVREHAEFASLVAAEEVGVPHRHLRKRDRERADGGADLRRRPGGSRRPSRPRAPDHGGR